MGEAARIGDNRFVLIFPGIMNSEHAEFTACKIQRLLDVPMQLDHEAIACIVNIGMLNSALRLSNRWTKQWGEQEVSVNIPAQILEQADFSDIVMSAWELWKPTGVRLCLELLEQSFTRDTESIFAKLKTLRNEGIRIAIDD